MKESGFLLINKHSGPTSHDMVNDLRQITGIKKIGHAGTLDPIASGLMILAIGREATKQIEQFVKLDKEYIADIKLGFSTKTYDRESEEIGGFKGEPMKRSELKAVLRLFTGKQKQVPPMYSAKKVKGQKLYKLARAGKEVQRDPCKVEIYKIKILAYSWPKLQLKVHCSSGTYIRSLAHDLGESLGCGGYLQELQRTKIGPFSLKQAVEIDQLDQDNWVGYLLGGY